LIVASYADTIRKVARKLAFLFSVFVRNRTAFLTLMTAVAIFKLALSAVAPASDTLRDILAWVDALVSQGPWVALDAQIYSFWRSVTLSTVSVSSWWLATPAAMSSYLRLLSLLLRLPSFMFDVGIAFALYYFVAGYASAREARFASLLWFLNPYTFMVVEMLAVPDVAVSFLTVLTVLFLCRKRVVLASLFFAAGIAIKLYPILLLPVILVYSRHRLQTRRWSEVGMISLSLLGLIGYLAWDFQLGSALVVYVLTEYTPVTQPLSSLFEFIVSTHISPAAIALVVTYFATWWLGRGSRITDAILPTLLIFYTFSIPYPQYYVWALPFMTLDIAMLKRRHLALLAVFLAFAGVYWFVASAGFLTPSGYSLLLFPLQGQNLPWYSQAIASFLKSTVTIVLLSPLLYSGLAAFTFIYAVEIIRYWFKQEDEKLLP
jgi:hypothetical protein